MIVDRTEAVEYPFSGTFSRAAIDRTGGLKQATQTTTTVLTTECDIQEAHSAAFVSTTYAVYFPTPAAASMVQVGDSFSASMGGVPVNGIVVSIYPSQLGGCLAYLKDFDS